MGRGIIPFVSKVHATDPIVSFHTWWCSIGQISYVGFVDTISQIWRINIEVATTLHIQLIRGSSYYTPSNLHTSGTSLHCSIDYRCVSNTKRDDPRTSVCVMHQLVAVNRHTAIKYILKYSPT